MAEVDVIASKTARFTSVVDKAGQPESYTLWLDPDKDPEFQKAIREERVMTVLREPASSKSDAAVVGYLKKSNALYLVFPKSLKNFREHRIVGLKYDLLSRPQPKGKPVTLEKKTGPTLRRKTHSRAPAPPAARPEPKPAPEPERKQPEPPARFRVQARISQTTEKVLEVEARNQREARRAAMAQLGRESSDVDSPRRVKITKVTKMAE